MRWMFVLSAFVFAAWPVRGDWGTPQNLGPGVNTAHDEYAPSLTINGDNLYFVRLEADSEDYNLYMSVFTGGAWDSAVALSDSINTASNGEVAPFISYDGGRLYFVRFPLANHNIFHIFYSEKRNGVWQSPTRFEATFNNDSSNASWPCFSHDGKRLYFYSFNRPGGVGLGDLWYSEYDSMTQTWGPPVNLGDSINTPYWDGSPTLSWDDHTLYFMRAVPPVEEFHIYRSVMVNGVWQGATKLPEPINYGVLNSNCPCLSADGQDLFFAGIDLPLPSYGRFDIYDSPWVLGVESQPIGSGPVSLLKISLANPLIAGSTIQLFWGGYKGSLSIVLYDLQGKRVRSWLCSDLRRQKLLWDGKDGSGAVLSSGIYFLVVASDLDRVFSKVVVLR